MNGSSDQTHPAGYAPELSEIRQRYLAVLERISAACRQAGRDPAGVSLLAVSKTFDADTVLALAGIGQRAFGENYLQEALPKMAAVDDRGALRASGRSEDAAAAGAAGTAAGARPDRVEWHFIGPMQSNKTRPVAERFDWVHSVDRERIALRLSEQRPAGLATRTVGRLVREMAAGFA
jgi:uncharacterized pyridoxal phosphate-containing UPF0001 family protein